MPASASAATSAGWVCGSSFTQARAEVSRYSAIPPSWDRPGNEPSLQCMSLPARQAAAPREFSGGGRTGGPPAAGLVPAGPPSAPRPAFAGPGGWGGGGSTAAPHPPSMMGGSVRQAPAPPILTTTSSGPLTLG